MKKPTIKQLQAELQQSRLTNEIALNNMQRKLQESIIGYAPPYDLINPFEIFMDGQKLLFPLFPSRLDFRTSSSYIWLTESQMDLLRAYARWLYETNSFVKGVMRGLKNFIIKDGFSYEVQPKRDMQADEGIIRSAQKILDQFQWKNKWHIRQAECFHRSRRDGEYFLRFFPQETGITIVRIIEPECIRAPNSTQEWTFGIRADITDRENVLEYHITHTGGEADGVYLDPDEVIHCKVNTDLGVKRGLSDLFAVQEMCDDAKKLLKSEMVGETIRASIAYIREFAQAQQSTIQALQTANTSFYEPLPTFTGSPTLQPVQQIVPGVVTDIPEGLTFKPGPSFNTASGMSVLQNSLQAIAQYWQIPSWLVTGESSSASYASSLLEESPFTRMCETEQAFYSCEYKAVMMRVLEIAVAQGNLPEEALEVLDIQVVTPSVVTRQRKEQTERHVMLHDKGILSKRSWSAQEDLDYSHEKENFKKDEPDFVPMEVKPELPEQKPTPKTDVTRK